MKNFTQWLENISQVSINNKVFDAEMQQAAEKIIHSLHDQADKVRSFQPNQFLQRIQQSLVNYPDLPKLMQSLQSKNHRWILDQQAKLRDWIMKQDYRQTSNLRTLSRDIFTYVDSLSSNHDVDESQVHQLVQNAIQGTNKNMLVIKQEIEEAVARIPNWSGLPIIIEPSSSHNQYGVDISVTNSALVYLGSDEYAPYFSLFKDLDDHPGIQIDDILEGGDTDFFQNTTIQSDYFNLIAELKNPGSVNKKGKILTLFTARPKKDRETFLRDKTLPTNVFLSNSYDHVEGLARDLGSQEVRDVWKVRIDSRYLTITLDGPVKYYQITSQNAPVLKLELL